MFDLPPAAIDCPVALVEVSEWQAALAAAAGAPADGLDDAERVELIRGLEELKSACAAVQARLTVEFRASQVAETEERIEQQLAEASEAAHREALRLRARHQRAEAARSVSGQVALARGESPVAGNRHVGVALAMTEMPHTFAALSAGLLSEWRATILVKETACLSVQDRAEVDARIAADTGACAGWGNRRLEAEAKRIATELDAASVVRRAAKARADRRVTSRPAPDTMSHLSALLPVEHGVAVHAALGKHADALRAGGDPRSRGQIMADTLVERVTGRSAETPVPVELELVMTSTALLDPTADGGHEPAWLSGYGIVPAELARTWAQTACSAEGLFVRRLFTRPTTGQLTAMESRARTAPPGLATFLRLRDQSCRTPWCDAPIRHLDHITPWSQGGTTSAPNLQGLCEACNHTRQAPGWQTRSRSPGTGRHRTLLTTPTGHRYRTTAPPSPGTPPDSLLERRLLDCVWAA